MLLRESVIGTRFGGVLVASPGASFPRRVGALVRMRPARNHVKMGNQEPWFGSLERAFRAALALVGHLALGLLMLGGIWVTEHWFRWLWGEAEPMLYGRVPLRYLFDTMDVAILIVFTVWGAWEAHRQLRGEH